jgi:predicted nucleic acid-binding protein
MKQAFADAGYWIAIVDKDDALHLKATTLARSAVSWEIITTEMVLTEMLNHVADFGPVYRQKAVSLVRTLRQTSSVRIQPFTEGLV